MVGPLTQKAIQQRLIRRYGASLGLIGLALLLSRYVTPSGASSPLVLLGATAAVAFFGGRWPAILATLTAATVNGVGIGIADMPRLAVESSMIVLLGTILAFRLPPSFAEEAETNEPLVGEALVTRVGEGPSAIESKTVDMSTDFGEASQFREKMDELEEDDATEVPAQPSILVVHGNAVLRLALRSTLSGLGYAVRDVANVSFAMSMLSSQEFDGVLIDLGRVDDTALSALERLRGSTSKKCLLLVAANAENQDDRELLQAAGADCVLTKPIDTAVVAAKLQGLIPTSSDLPHSRVGFGASP